MTQSNIHRAALSRSQNREGWSIIFKHPVRVDEVTGKPGKRVRRGLSTRDRSEAEALVSQMNELLSNVAYWDVSAKPAAEQHFDSRLVEIFFYRIAPEEIDFEAVREQYIPLPTAETDDYRRVLLLGTTGAGKTTLVRQLIGTEPNKERFPSTSTARTTVADMEFVLTKGDYRGIVTFHQRDEVREALEDCVSSAILSSYLGADKQEILRRLLNHIDQRFRFSYIYGSGKGLWSSNTLEEDFENDDDAEEDDFEGGVDLSQTNEVLRTSVDNIQEISSGIAKDLKEALGVDGQDDKRTLDEIFEEEIERLVRDSQMFYETVDTLLDELEARFDALDSGKLTKNRQGWPTSWSLTTSDREDFLKAIRRFSSNYAPLFGTLLTPLVNGVRVAGPFSAPWSDSQPRLVLLDGEGLGHTPDSSSSIPTALMKRVEEVDAVVLVDNAQQPMQAASMAALRSLVSSGNMSKLMVCFTHFDSVGGDNLPDVPSKKAHVLASAEAVLTSFRDEFGAPAERVLRARLERGSFFAGGIQAELNAGLSSGRRTIAELNGLLDAIEHVIEKPSPIQSRPVYDRLNLVLAIRRATVSFHGSWNAKLGLEIRPGTQKEHWTRIKALSRRLATPGWADEYDTLKPVAELAQLLRTRVYVLILNPLRWEGEEPSEDEKQQIFDTFADRVSRGLRVLTTSRIRKERQGEWQDAYYRRGYGSSFERAHIIANEVFGKAAPIPDVTPSPDRNRFLNEVVKAVGEAAEESDVLLS